MRWKRPDHTRWLAACLAGLGISAWIGGFSLSLAVIFVILFAAGAALITLEDPGTPRPAAEPASDEAAAAT